MPRKFVVLVATNGVAALASLAATGLWAASVDRPGFVLINAVLLSTIVIGIAGGGLDASVIREWASGPDDPASVLRYVVRAKLCIVGVGTAISILPLSTMSLAADIPIELSLGTVLVMGLATSAHGTVIGLYQGGEKYGLYAVRHLTFYGSLAGCAAAVLCAGLSTSGGLFLLVGTASVWLLTFTVRYGRMIVGSPEVGDERNHFGRSARLMSFATIGYAVFERVDVLVIGAIGAPDAAAEYAIAMRLAGGLAVVTGPWSAYVYRALASVRSIRGLPSAALKVSPEFGLLVTCFACALFLIRPGLSLLGAPITSTLIIATALSMSQYLLAAIEAVFFAAAVGVQRFQWLVIATLILLSTKLISLLVLFSFRLDSPIFLVGATLLSHGAALFYLATSFAVGYSRHRTNAADRGA